MDKLQALQAGTVRPPEGKSAASESPDGEVRGSRGFLLRMRDMNPPEGPLHQAPYITPFDDGYDVRGPKATGVKKESARTTVLVFHRPAEGIQLSRPHTSLAGTRSLWSTAADDRGDPPIPRWDESMRAE